MVTDDEADPGVVPAEPLMIFDCDGVLVDSEVLVAGIEAELLGQFGVAMTAHEVAEAFVGLSDHDMHRLIEERWGVELTPEFAAEKARRIDRSLLVELDAVPGM